MTDVTPTVEARYSSSKLWRAAGLLTIPTLGCASLGFSPYVSKAAVAIMEFGAVFCGGMVVYFIYLAARKSDQVAFSIGPDGIWDKRISDEVIPWQSVEAVRTLGDEAMPRSTNDDRIVLLELKEADAGRLHIERIAKLASGLDRSITGSKGLQIRTGGTDVNYAKLLEVSQFYLTKSVRGSAR